MCWVTLIYIPILFVPLLNFFLRNSLCRLVFERLIHKHFPRPVRSCVIGSLRKEVRKKKIDYANDGGIRRHILVDGDGVGDDDEDEDEDDDRFTFINTERLTEMKDSLLKQVQNLAHRWPLNTLDHLIVELGGPNNVAVS